MPRAYKFHDEKVMAEAISAMKGGLSSRQAAARYGIPRTTLQDHVSERVKSGARPGNGPLIPREIETILVKEVMAAAEKGFGIGPTQLRQRVGRLMKKLNIRSSGKPPGKKWLRGLRKRHPQLTLRKPQKLSANRTRMMNRQVISSYFEDITKILENATPESVWNADEKGFQLEHQPTNVFCKRGAKRVPGRTANSRESITVLGCCNASGSFLPPMVVARGKTTRWMESYIIVYIYFNMFTYIIFK